MGLGLTVSILISDTIRPIAMLTSNLDDIGCISILGATTIIS